MGQIASFFRDDRGRPGSSSSQQDTGSGKKFIADDSKLTDRKIEELSQVIVSKHMATIAMKYLEIRHETVENLKIIRQNDYIAFNRDLLAQWRNKNQGINQVQVS